MDMRNGGEIMPTGRHAATHPTARPDGDITTALLARWLLLGVVIAAVFGLLVLTVDHGNLDTCRSRAPNIPWDQWQQGSALS